MSISTFGVTYSTVRQDWFPQFTSEFNATSQPTSTRVTNWIKEEAADLAGALRLKALTAADIDGLGVNYDAYQWCAKTLGLAVACRVANVMSGASPELKKDLAAQLKDRMDRLEKHGAEALGAGATVSDSTDEPEGPTSHIDELDLDTGESDGVTSDVAPVIRRADML
jgi:hypothetical protein